MAFFVLHIHWKFMFPVLKHSLCSSHTGILNKFVWRRRVTISGQYKIIKIAYIFWIRSITLQWITYLLCKLSCIDMRGVNKVSFYIQQYSYRHKTDCKLRILSTCTLMDTVWIPAITCDDWQVHKRSWSRDAVHVTFFMTVAPTVMDDVPELKQSQVNVGNGLPPLTEHESSPWLFSTTL